MTSCGIELCVFKSIFSSKFVSYLGNSRIIGLFQIIREKEGELNLLRDNVFELQGQLQNAYIRIKELREKLDGDTD